MKETRPENPNALWLRFCEVPRVGGPAETESRTTGAGGWGLEEAGSGELPSDADACISWRG